MLRRATRLLVVLVLLLLFLLLLLLFRLCRRRAQKKRRSRAASSVFSIGNNVTNTGGKNVILYTRTHTRTHVASCVPRAFFFGRSRLHAAAAATAFEAVIHRGGRRRGRGGRRGRELLPPKRTSAASNSFDTGTPLPKRKGVVARSRAMATFRARRYNSRIGLETRLQKTCTRIRARKSR